MLSELTPAYCELLARQTLLLVSESDQNSADEKVLLTMFGCRSLVVAAVVDEGLSVYGLLIFTRAGAAGGCGLCEAASADGAVHVWTLCGDAGL